MIRPSLKQFKKPLHINDYPTGPSYECGHLVTKNAGWRTFKPQIELDKCKNCLRCYLVCPDGVIFKTTEKVAIDYDFCKGCGICAHECKFKAITMVKEGAE